MAVEGGLLNEITFVVPTLVGMNRIANEIENLGKSCPHARGDGPSKAAFSMRSRSLSPRSWGWTVTGRPSRVLAASCPHAAWGWTVTGRPSAFGSELSHARGDGPVNRHRELELGTLSPR